MARPKQFRATDLPVGAQIIASAKAKAWWMSWTPNTPVDAGEFMLLRDTFAAEALRDFNALRAQSYDNRKALANALLSMKKAA